MTVPDLSTREGREQMRREAEDELYGDCHTGVTALWLSRSLSILDALDTAEARTEEVARAGADYANQVTDDLRRAEARADRAEAALQRVRNVIDETVAIHHTNGIPDEDRPDCMCCHIQQAIDGDDGDPGRYCNRGPCCLGNGHAGPCRM